jgi:predicted phosphodiesterase
MGIRVISDVHGKKWDYCKIAKEVDFTVQLGDLDFNYDWLYALDADNHKVIAGNHDNYAKMTPEDEKFMYQTPHFLGDFGTYTLGGVEFFFVRGGRSIDEEYRTLGIDYWPEEQLNYHQSYLAIDKYRQIKPRIMITHECPTSIIDYVSKGTTWKGQPIRPSHTANLLQTLFELHQPEIFIFGHHHRHFDMVINKTRFICLPELGYFDLEY